jgi:N-acetylglucosaminyl-diphospho-decaprenol L-rhamnosyltransferase
VTELSIIIVSYNARADLEACIESLTSAPPSLPHDITVVDNASIDGGFDTVRLRWPSIRAIRLDRNVGFAAANNVGIRATAGRRVLLLNSDTVVPAGALDRLVSRLDAHPHAAIAGPRLIGGDGVPELSFGAMISPLVELRQKTLVALLARGAAPARWWVQRATRRERYVDWVSGACLLVHRRDAEAAGLIDERYFLYTEDVDFCAAVRARGRLILFTPAAEVVHLRGRSRATAPDSANTAYRRSQLAFYEKHHPGWARWLRMYLRLKRELPKR